jgi:redox-sensitive bicupin YhaK (pirin superfamily)
MSTAFTPSDSVELMIAGRPRDLGGFEVRRVLPAPQRRLVGPFIFFDHIGPAELAPGRGIDVRPHPHIGLATVTFLFGGELLHRDNLGSVQAIEPGAVNWMIAGRGIAHSERTAPERRASGGQLFGIQSWVALPLAEEETEPRFEHHPARTLPRLSRPGVELDVIAGSAFGARSPVSVLSPTLYVHAQLTAGASLTLDDEHAERAAHVVEGAIRVDGQRFETGQLVVFRQGALVEFTCERPARLMLVGGASVGERHIYWNFVSSSKERIERAKDDWRAGNFATIPGDETEFIPLPEI